MFTNNNLNPVKPIFIDDDTEEVTMKFWNFNEIKDITYIKTTKIDINDKRVWTRENINKLWITYEKKWILDNYRSIHPIMAMQYILRNFDLNSNDDIFNAEEFKKKVVKEVEKLCLLKSKVREMSKHNGKIISKQDWDGLSDKLKRTKFHEEEYISYHESFNKMMEIIYYYSETIIYFSNGIEASNPYHDTGSAQNNKNKLIARKWVNPDEEQDKDHQKLLKLLLEICETRKYKKYKELIYRPVYTKNNHYTFSCQKVTDIEKFVYEETSRDRNPMFFDLATKDKSTINFMQTHLKNCKDNSLPDLIKNRNLFSFNNGIYELYQEQEDGKYTDRFYPYEHKDRPEMETGTVCSKYFDIKMDYQPISDWYDISTPNIDKILDLQFSHEKDYKNISRWFYILLGRLLYRVGQMDDWQVIAFMKGLAGTGKGTACKTVQRFYAPEDVGVLGNDAEKTFGLSAIYDKLLFVAPEIKEDISLPQASFQSMISGEEVSVPIKHKTAESITWEVPGILAGNEVPNWTDNSGSIARRLIIFAFNKKVPRSKSDPNLSRKITENIPNILRKCNLAYLDAVNNFCKKNIWDILPKYFRLRQDELSEHTNELKKFLKSPGIVYGYNCHVSEKELKYKFLEYLKENNIKSYRYSPDKLNEPFQTLEEEYETEIAMVRIDKRKKEHKTNTEKLKELKGNWIRGLSIQDDTTGEHYEDEDVVTYLKYIETLE